MLYFVSRCQVGLRSLSHSCSSTANPLLSCQPLFSEGWYQVPVMLAQIVIAVIPVVCFIGKHRVYLKPVPSAKGF